MSVSRGRRMGSGRLRDDMRRGNGCGGTERGARVTNLQKGWLLEARRLAQNSRQRRMDGCKSMSGFCRRSLLKKGKAASGGQQPGAGINHEIFDTESRYKTSRCQDSKAGQQTSHLPASECIQCRVQTSECSGRQYAYSGPKICGDAELLVPCCIACHDMDWPRLVLRFRDHSSLVLRSHSRCRSSRVILYLKLSC